MHSMPLNSLPHQSAKAFGHRRLNIAGRSPAGPRWLCVARLGLAVAPRARTMAVAPAVGHPALLLLRSHQPACPSALMLCVTKRREQHWSF